MASFKIGIIAAILVATLGLTGCVPFHDQPLWPQQSSAAFQSRTLSDQGLREFLQAHQMSGAWPRKTWNFAALSLAAFYFQPSLEVARARWEVARSGIEAAAERPNPTLRVTPGYNTSTTVPTPWIVTPSLDVPIETAGKRGHRLAQAQELSEAARLNIATVAWKVRGDVWQGMVRLHSARSKEELLQRQLDLQTASAELMEEQFRAGAVSTFEAAQARISRVESSLAQQHAQSQIVIARSQLAEAIGVPASALDPVTIDFRELETLPSDVPYAAARLQALLHRSDILGSLAEYAASQAALQLEIAKQYPDIRLSPGYEYDQGDNKWSLGLSVTLPVLNQNRAAISTAEGRRKESAARFEELQARVIAETERAVTDYRLALQKRAVAGELNRALAGQLRGAQARLEAGETSKLELTLHQLELNTAAQALLTAEEDAQTALGALENALQSPAAWIVSVESSPRMSQKFPP